MKTVTRARKAMQAVLIDEANRLAIESGFMKRERVLTGSSFVCGLVSGWQNNPEASLEALSQAVGNAGTPISRQGLAYRFDAEAADFLQRVLAASLEQMVSATPVSAGILSRFECVDLVDSSVITLPNSLQDIWCGSGGYGANASVAALKLNVRLDVRHGCLKTLDISDGTQHDRRSIAHTQPLSRGSLQLADLGYFKLDDFERIAAQGAFWISRYKLNTAIFDCQGEPIDLPSWLPQQIDETLDCVIRMGKTKQLPCRLVAQRVPLTVVRQRHERIHETARQNQAVASPLALAMAHWTVYVTNVPPTLLTEQEVFLLGRYRWQIELLFKLWKSDLQVDTWRSLNPHRILCEICGKLIAAIVTHWLLLVACWHNPRRSFRLAMHTIRGLAWQFANSIHNNTLLRHAFDALLRATSKSNMSKSLLDPRAWQLIYEDIA